MTATWDDPRPACPVFICKRQQPELVSADSVVWDDPRPTNQKPTVQHVNMVASCSGDHARKVHKALCCILWRFGKRIGHALQRAHPTRPCCRRPPWTQSWGSWGCAFKGPGFMGGGGLMDLEGQIPHQHPWVCKHFANAQDCKGWWGETFRLSWRFPRFKIKYGKRKESSYIPDPHLFAQFDSTLGLPGEGPMFGFLVWILYHAITLGSSSSAASAWLLIGVLNAEGALACKSIPKGISHGDRVRQAAREGIELLDGRRTTESTAAAQIAVGKVQVLDLRRRTSVWRYFSCEAPWSWWYQQGFYWFWKMAIQDW